MLSRGCRLRQALGMLRISRSYTTHSASEYIQSLRTRTPSPSSTTRVRFAPSPTGFLHLGGLRTALYNFVFALQKGGTNIVRIEDTDQSRFVAGAEESLLDHLKWAGVAVDESPLHPGPYGPYRQSERLHIYQDVAQRMISDGTAYKCFCTSTRLEGMRKEQARAGLPQQYDGKCRHLSADEVAEHEQAGIPHTIRLRVDQCAAGVDGDAADANAVQVEDRVHGSLTFPTTQIDDQILLKSDGFPTYHLANVVDDYLMHVSHVIRGQEWLSSTPKHVLLYRNLGIPAPIFVHLPLLLHSDRSKLSKRHQHAGIDYYRTAGYEPEALLNFVALLGWSPPSDFPNGDVLSIDDLVKYFDWDRVQKSPAVVNEEKLQWLNSQHIRRFSNEELLSRASPHFQRHFGDSFLSSFAPEYITSALGVLKERIVFLNQLPELSEYFFREPDMTQIPAEVVSKMWFPKSSMTILGALVERIEEAATWDSAAATTALNSVKSSLKVPFKEVSLSTRLAITGMAKGGSLAETMYVLGKDSVLVRLKAGMACFGKF